MNDLVCDRCGAMVGQEYYCWSDEVFEGDICGDHRHSGPVCFGKMKYMTPEAKLLAEDRMKRERYAEKYL